MLVQVFLFSIGLLRTEEATAQGKTHSEAMGDILTMLHNVRTPGLLYPPLASGRASPTRLPFH